MTNKQLLLSHLHKSSFGRMTMKAICRELQMVPSIASRYLNQLHKEGFVGKERMGMNTVFKVNKKDGYDCGTKEMEVM